MPETTPRGLTRLAFGGDYNPEQWPEERLAGGRPADAGGRRHPGQCRDLLLGAAGARHPVQYDFGWLDRLLDLLHENGIRVDLGTPTVARRSGSTAPTPRPCP